MACRCGGRMVWVRILSNHHRTQFCAEWVAREIRDNPTPFFVVEGYD